MMLPGTPLQTVALLFVMQAAIIVKAEDNQTMLFDFSKPDSAEAWQTVNDGVMGGVSDGKVRIAEKIRDAVVGEQRGLCVNSFQDCQDGPIQVRWAGLQSPWGWARIPSQFPRPNQPDRLLVPGQFQDRE